MKHRKEQERIQKILVGGMKFLIRLQGRAQKFEKGWPQFKAKPAGPDIVKSKKRRSSRSQIVLYTNITFTLCICLRKGSAPPPPPPVTPLG